MEWEAPNSMHFAFRGLVVSWGARKLLQKAWQPQPEAHKTYRFRHVGDSIAVLASSAGGFILMRKEINIAAE